MAIISKFDTLLKLIYNIFKNSTWKTTFENVFFSFRIDDFERTSSVKGILGDKNSKKGDFVLTEKDTNKKIVLEVKKYCKVGSILDKIDRKYDLVICIEVIEHLFEEDSKIALNNLCECTDDIIFSSSPEDFEEKTHHNVQKPSYWANLFAKNKFYRDVKSDVTHITSWAGRFIKKEKMVPIIADYEDRLWELNADKQTMQNNLYL